MSQAAFQSALAELIAGTEAESERQHDISDRDRSRLSSVASQHGVHVMRTLYFSWRLTKVLSLLPLTTGVLGHESTARQLRRFWRESKARSFYFVDECLAFLRFLDRNLDGIPLPLGDAMAFELARLELRAEAARGKRPQPRRIRLRHPPDLLLAALPGRSAVRPGDDIMLEGSFADDEGERWIVVEAAANDECESMEPGDTASPIASSERRHPT